MLHHVSTTAFFRGSKKRTAADAAVYACKNGLVFRPLYLSESARRRKRLASPSERAAAIPYNSCVGVPPRAAGWVKVDSPIPLVVRLNTSLLISPLEIDPQFNRQG